MRILCAVVGAIVGAIVGIVFGLFVATVIGGSNDLFIGFLRLYCVPFGLIAGAVIGIIAGLRLIRYLSKTGVIRQNALLLAGLIVGLSTVVAGMLWAVSNRSKPPPDRQLLVNFDRHEATFNKLIEMLKVDNGLIRVDIDWTEPKNLETIGVSPSRISTYRRMLRDARVRRGFQSKGLMYEVDFFYWGIGSAISSDTTKGYAYTTVQPVILRQSLDGCSPDPENIVRIYRHIRGNWYLFYEYIPG